MIKLTEENPRLTRAIWKDTLIDAAIFRQWVTNLGRKDAYARIAHLICELFVRMNAIGLVERNTMEWPMNQTEIGDAVGLSYVHVNRTLQELRGNNLIALKENRLTVLDWEGLKAAADFDIGYLFL
jgi:CRP-like cAMP-binding protein